MKELVKIVECPRDAWQGLPVQIPPDRKAAYLQRLIATGFTHIDAVSFVSPAAVPQMADSEEVLQLLGKPPAEVEIIGIVVNPRGAQRAIATGMVNTLGFPYSISPEFLSRNQRQTQMEALHALTEVRDLAHHAGLGLVAYISMAFGNPYDDPWSPSLVVDACATLKSYGIHQISLADTVGVATSFQLMQVIGEVVAEYADLEIGVHLHAGPNDAPDLIKAAFSGGCRRFDAAIGGLGGCPFAQDALVGNIPTETLLAVLSELDAALSQIQSPDQLEELISQTHQIASEFGHQPLKNNHHVPGETP
ncbi:MAG: hydroxymethylglutaryl-CoA lyase [Acidobacteriaceae bacterium]